MAAPQQGLGLVAYLGLGLALDCKRPAGEKPFLPVSDVSKCMSRQELAGWLDFQWRSRLCALCEAW